MPQAAAVHHLFLTHLWQQLAESGLRRVICVDPPESVADLRAELENQGLTNHWEVTEQSPGTLGERMRRWFQQELGRDDSARAILIGGDCPTIRRADIDRAFAALEQHPVVLGPATDGGYVLIGLRGPWESGRTSYDALFDQIPWSTDAVLDITRQRLRDAAMPFAELPTMSDVDTQADLEQLIDSLATDDPGQLIPKINELLTDSATGGGS